jgi:hypothetical protein
VECRLLSYFILYRSPAATKDGINSLAKQSEDPLTGSG